MSKAEEIHYKAVMAADNQEPPKDYVISAHADHFNGFVEGFIEGYHQAEKDLELTLEDIPIILHHCEQLKISWWFRDDENTKKIGTQPFYEEVLKRFIIEKKNL